MKIEKVNIKDLVMNPSNPRTIKDDKFKKLVKSIKEFPGLIKSYLKSNRWKLTSFDSGIKVNNNFNNNELSKRLKASFFYVPKNYKENIWDIL